MIVSSKYINRDEIFVVIVICLALTYQLQLDHDKSPVDQRLFFRETSRTIKKRYFKISNHICHDYSLYMKVGVVS